MMGFGLLVPFLVLAALAYALGWLPQDSPQQSRKHSQPSALDILDERYARGEISRTEYLEMRSDLNQ